MPRIISGLVVLVLVAGCSFDSGRWSAPTLTQWVESAKRPGFSLLDQVELRDYYICVFDTGKSEVVLFYRWKNPEGKPNTHSLVVKDGDGRNLQDKSRWNTVPDYQHGSNGEFFDGMVIPIVKSQDARVHVELKASSGPDLVFHTVYEKAVSLSGAADGEEEGS